MTITLDNISEAVASAEQHQDYAILMGLSGNRTEARRHAAHSKAIIAEVMRLTAPADPVSDDDLDDLAVAIEHETILAGLKAPHSRIRESNGRHVHP